MTFRAAWEEAGFGGAFVSHFGNTQWVESCNYMRISRIETKLIVPDWRLTAHPNEFVYLITLYNKYTR